MYGKYYKLTDNTYYLFFKYIIIIMTTFITSEGTLSLSDNLHNKNNKVGWNANYDGDSANVKLNVSDKNGHKNKFNFKLSNEDLAKILSIQSVNTPLHRRLEDDFLKNIMSNTIGNNSHNNGSSSDSNGSSSDSNGSSSDSNPYLTMLSDSPSSDLIQTMSREPELDLGPNIQASMLRIPNHTPAINLPLQQPIQMTTPPLPPPNVTQMLVQPAVPHFQMMVPAPVTPSYPMVQQPAMYQSFPGQMQNIEPDRSPLSIAVIERRGNNCRHMRLSRHSYKKLSKKIGRKIGRKISRAISIRKPVTRSYHYHPRQHPYYNYPAPKDTSNSVRHTLTPHTRKQRQLYRTPSPKTLHMHFKTPSSTGRGKKTKRVRK
jgi:hypothetical protein